MKAAIFQADARPSTPMERLSRLDDALGGATDMGLDIVVCPELFLSGYSNPPDILGRAEAVDGPSAEMAASIARKHSVAIVYGYPQVVDGRFFNAALCLSKNGEVLANHQKKVFPGAHEKCLFTPGTGAGVFTLDDGAKAALLICCEAELPEAVRACALAGAVMVIVPTALGGEWGGVANRVIPSRAFENGVFVLYANYAGKDHTITYLGESAIVSPRGNDLARAGAVETLISANIDLSEVATARERLPYLMEHASARWDVASPANPREQPRE